MMLFWIDRPAMTDLRPAIRHVGNGSPIDSTNQGFARCISATGTIAQRSWLRATMAGLSIESRWM